MTPAEAEKLLTLIRQIDNKIGESDEVRASLWAEILNDTSLEGAKAAVKAHYRKAEAQTILPGDIAAGARKLLADHVARIERSTRNMDWDSAIAKANAEEKIVTPAPKSVSDREKKRQKHADAVAAQDERAAANPAYAEALAFMRSRCKPTVASDLESWKVSYRGTSNDLGPQPQRLGPMLRVIEGELAKRVSDDAA